MAGPSRPGVRAQDRAASSSPGCRRSHGKPGTRRALVCPPCSSLGVGSFSSRTEGEPHTGWSAHRRREGRGISWETSGPPRRVSVMWQRSRAGKGSNKGSRLIRETGKLAERPAMKYLLEVSKQPWGTTPCRFRAGNFGDGDSHGFIKPRGGLLPNSEVPVVLGQTGRAPRCRDPHRDDGLRRGLLVVLGGLTGRRRG